MKGVKLFVIGGTLVVLLLIPLRMYGTLNPCGWLKIELKQAMTQKATQINTTSDAGAVGAMLGLPASPASMNQMVDAMQPDQCLKKLYQIKKVGGVEAYMKAQQENQPSALDFAKKQVERHRQELKYWEDRVKFQEAQQGKN